jgi:hypothetical protein
MKAAPTFQNTFITLRQSLARWFNRSVRKLMRAHMLLATGMVGVKFFHQGLSPQLRVKFFHQGLSPQLRVVLLKLWWRLMVCKLDCMLLHSHPHSVGLYCRLMLHQEDWMHLQDAVVLMAGKERHVLLPYSSSVRVRGFWMR